MADCNATLGIRDEINGGNEVIFQAVEQLILDMIKIGFRAAAADGKKSIILNCLSEENLAVYCIDYIPQTSWVEIAKPTICETW